MGAPARIHLLGRFNVEIDGAPIAAAAWKKRRPVEVLTALALAQGRTLHREELVDRLWPDKDLDAGANNLHRALHDLRRIVGAEIVTIDRGAVRLADDVWIDVVAFEQAAAAATSDSLAQAIEIYGGELLPEDPYSDALAARREALRQRFADAALKLAELRHASSEREACIDVLRRVLAIDPALEPAHRLLMRALAEADRAGDALRQFAECTTALKEKLDVAPSRATLDLRRAIEAGEIAAGANGARSNALAQPASADARVDVEHATRRLLGRDAARPLCGRTDALAEMRRVIDEKRGVLLVVGEAGLGKTRLAAECVRLAARAGATVLVGLGSVLDAGVPYAPFVDAWADHRRHTGGAGDPFQAFAPSGGSAQEDRLRLFQAIERAVESLARGSCLCLVIEDLHQADESSLHLFHHLARATRGLPLVLVGTLREEGVRVGTPLHALAGSLGRERLAQRIVLERLDREAVAELVADVLGADRARDVAVEVHTLAEGNPFHAEEVARAMRDANAERPFAPASLLETVRHRVRALGRDAERLLVASAVTGHRFPFEIARIASGLEPEAALDALKQAIEARIVEEDDGEYRFRHALARQALIEGVTHARRVYLHRVIAEAYESRGAASEHAETLARHHEGAGQPDRALPHLLVAAERAQKRLGFSEAVAFLERARELMDALGIGAGIERFKLLRATGGMRMALSDLDGAVRDLDAAAALGDDAWQPSAGEVATVRRIASLALIQGGRLDEAQARLEHALELLDAADSSELPSVLYLFAQLRWHQERFAEARTLADRSLDEAEKRGDRGAMAKGHEMLALACHSLGEWSEGREHEARRGELAQGSLDVDQAFDVHLCLWEYHLYGGSRGIRSAVETTLEQARRMGAPRAVALCRCFAGTLDFQAGRWTDAEAALREAITLYRQVNSACGESLSLQRLGVLLTARGALDEARACLDEGLVVGGRAAMRSHCLTRVHASLARNRLAARDVEGARASLRDGIAEVARHGRCSTCSSLLLPEAVRVELAEGDAAAAARHATELEGVAARYASELWTAMAKQARGRVLAARGDSAAAFEALEDARRAFVASDAPYEAARCRALQAATRRDDAALKAEAKAAFDALGASENEA